MWQTNMQNLAVHTHSAVHITVAECSLSLQGQRSGANQYYNSQRYKDLAGQARYQSLAAAGATGGLGSTATGNRLAAIAPTSVKTGCRSDEQLHNNLANIGLGALTGQANAGRTTLTTSASCTNSRRQQRQQMRISLQAYRGFCYRCHWWGPHRVQ